MKIEDKILEDFFEKHWSGKFIDPTNPNMLKAIIRYTYSIGYNQGYKDKEINDIKNDILQNYSSEH